MDWISLCNGNDNINILANNSIYCSFWYEQSRPNAHPTFNCFHNLFRNAHDLSYLNQFRFAIIHHNTMDFSDVFWCELSYPKRWASAVLVRPRLNSIYQLLTIRSDGADVPKVSWKICFGLKLFRTIDTWSLPTHFQKTNKPIDQMSWNVDSRRYNNFNLWHHLVSDCTNLSAQVVVSISLWFYFFVLEMVSFLFYDLD